MLARIGFVFLLVLLGMACSPKMAQPEISNWRNLIIDEELSNFEIKNGTAEYYLEDNSIVGISKADTPNSFLCTKEHFGDFILEFEVWADPLLNSGVQFRSISDPAIMDGRVHGYQVEIESSPRKWAGGIYDEARRGWLYSLDTNPEAKEAFKVDKWNHYRIEAIGDEIVTYVNKVQCTYLIDDMTERGFIGFQVHSIENKEQENKKVKWRNIRIKTSNLESEIWPRSSNVTKVIKSIEEK